MKGTQSWRLSRIARSWRRKEAGRGLFKKCQLGSSPST